MDIDQLTAADFASDKVHEWLWSLGSRQWDQRRVLNALKEQAKAVDYSGFLGDWQAYQKQKRMMQAKPVGNVASFRGSDLELDSGAWICSETSIYQQGERGDIIACTHPILPLERLINADTGLEKIKLLFRPGATWRSAIVEKSTLASNNRIIALADIGVAVTSESSKALVRFLSDMESLNYGDIKSVQSIGRLGWVNGSFVPFDGEIVFDGEQEHKQIFKSVRPKGKLSDWIKWASKIRKTEPVATRMVLAASFASILCELVNSLPFFVHIWGKTGKGKTVALMMAASVWGNPANDAYLQSFNGTQNSFEALAGFFNSLPLIMDESQLQKTNDGKIQFNVYKLSDGSSKGRMTKTLGSQPKQRWRNCILTSGEQPLTDGQSGGGALNRVISINADLIGDLFRDPAGVVDFILQNHGTAGKAFVEAVKTYTGEDLRSMFDSIKGLLQRFDVTDKQVMAGAVVLMGDTLASQHLFKDGAGLTPEDVAQFLLSKSAASAEERAFEMLVDWLAMNDAQFSERAVLSFGFKRNGITFIIRKAFDGFCKEQGISSEVFAGWLIREGKTVTNENRSTYRVRMDGGQLLRMIAVKNAQEQLEEFVQVY